jgi:hypothetical protein
MSKPVLRIAVVLIVGIIILVGVFATVQAAASTVGTMRGNHFLTAGLLPDRQHARESKPQLQQYYMQEDFGPGGGCEHDAVDSSDY